MKNKEWQSYKGKKDEELTQDLNTHYARVESLREDLVKGKVKNINEVRMTKKMIARILTLRRERAITTTK